MARVARPKKVKVKESEFSIIPRSKAWGQKHEAYGRITYEKQMIEFDQSQTPRELVDTLIHECLHLIVSEYEITFKTMKLEEQAVTKMANGITDLFTHNPNLLDWVKSNLKRENQ